MKLLILFLLSLNLQCQSDLVKDIGRQQNRIESQEIGEPKAWYANITFDSNTFTCLEYPVTIDTIWFDDLTGKQKFKTAYGYQVSSKLIAKEQGTGKTKVTFGLHHKKPTQKDSFTIKGDTDYYLQGIDSSIWHVKSK